MKEAIQMLVGVINSCNLAIAAIEPDSPQPYEIQKALWKVREVTQEEVKKLMEVWK